MVRGCKRKDNTGSHYSASAESVASGDSAEHGGVERSRMIIKEALSNSLGPRQNAKLPSIDYFYIDQDVNYNEFTFYGKSIHTGMVENSSTARASLNNVVDNILSARITFVTY